MQAPRKFPYSQQSHQHRPSKLWHHCFKGVSISLLYLYSNSSILDPPLGFLRCRCIAVMCTGRPALSAVWHVILTAPGTAHSVPDTFQLLRGMMRNTETLRSWPKMKKMLYELCFSFYFLFTSNILFYFSCKLTKKNSILLVNSNKTGRWEKLTQKLKFS